MTRPPDVKEVEKEIEEIRAQKEGAIKAQDFEKAAALRDTEKQAKEKLETILTQWREQREEKEVVVGEEDIMHVVSKWTGVPLSRMEQAETAKLLKMEEELRGKVIGQEEAVVEISARLVEEGAGRIAAARVFAVRLPVAGEDGPAAAAALDAALGDVMGQIVLWTAGRL